MNRILVLVSLLLSINSFADDSKHMIIFGNDVSLGWSGSAAKADVDSSLNIKDYMVGNGNLSLNYAYRLTPRFQLGAFLSTETDTSEVEAKAGGKIKSDSYSSEVLLVGTINFDDDFQDSFYVSGGLGKSWYNSESKDTTGSSVDKSETKYDANVLYLAFGKRFNLKGLGIENLTYSPSITYIHYEVNGDLEDAGVNSITGVQLDLVKFDLLF